MKIYLHAAGFLQQLDQVVVVPATPDQVVHHLLGCPAGKQLHIGGLYPAQVKKPAPSEQRRVLVRRAHQLAARRLNAALPHQPQLQGRHARHHDAQAALKRIVQLFDHL